jgi:hypothetical protein
MQTLLRCGGCQPEDRAAFLQWSLLISQSACQFMKNVRFPGNSLSIDAGKRNKNSSRQVREQRTAGLAVVLKVILTLGSEIRLRSG